MRDYIYLVVPVHRGELCSLIKIYFSQIESLRHSLSSRRAEDQQDNSERDQHDGDGDPPLIQI